MRRVLIIGIPGAGKSTFARVLADRTALPLIHLDKEYWLPGWKMQPRAQWRPRVQELAAGERWIMEGNYESSLHLRLPRADAVIWFDYPTLKCLWRVFGRIASTYGQVRADMAPGCPERLDWEFLRYVWRFNSVERPKTVAALAQFGAHLQPVVFRRDDDVRNFSRRIPDNLDTSLVRDSPCPRSAPPAMCPSRRARCSIWSPTWSDTQSSCRCARRWPCDRASARARGRC